jgi:hypothetical protein
MPTAAAGGLGGETWSTLPRLFTMVWGVVNPRLGVAKGQDLVMSPVEDDDDCKDRVCLQASTSD